MSGDTQHVKELEHDNGREFTSRRLHPQHFPRQPTKKAGGSPTGHRDPDALVSDTLPRSAATTRVRRQPGRKQAAGRIRVCHVPKTIDNDLPLPERFHVRFETARQLGSSWCKNLMEDSRTTAAVFIVVMGRSAGHLASASARPPAPPHDHPGGVSWPFIWRRVAISWKRDTKRKALWNRVDGVAIIARLLERSG